VRVRDFADASVRGLRQSRGVAETTFTPGGLDALPPPDVAHKAEDVGIAKAGLSAVTTLTLGVLAGAFIALGAVVSTTAATGGAELPLGVTRLLAGVAFSLGLILVVVAGAELFTGNNLIVMAWAGRRVSTARLLRNWGLVYAGNLVGALGTAFLVLAAKQYELGGDAVGVTALSIGVTKSSYGFVQAVALGVLCNALVCLAVWMAYSARSATDKVLVIVPPIAAFVAAGFEHSVANMYFLPYALFVKDWTDVPDTAGVPDLTRLTWGNAVLGNLLPVTIGNIIGGGLLVGAVYWFAYLRRSA
jgi:formate transporter